MIRSNKKPSQHIPAPPLILSYYDFLLHAQEAFPDYNFGSLDIQASGLDQMNLAGGQFITNNRVLGEILFSSSSGICRKHSM